MTDDRLAKLLVFLEKDPDDAFTQYALALEYTSRGDKEQATHLLELLLRKDPAYVPAYQQLGFLYQELDRLTEACAILRQGIAVAARSGDHHAGREMQDTLDELEDKTRNSR